MRHPSRTQETNESGAGYGLRVADNPTEILKRDGLVRGAAATEGSADRAIFIVAKFHKAFRHSNGSYQLQ
jgi:hypothetical protein